MKQLLGCDISHYQLNFDWSKPFDFVIIKASEGLTNVDPMFKTNQAEARKKGVKTGYYHFSDSFDPIKEADHFLNTVGQLLEGEFLCLDAETGQSETYCQKFLEHLEAETGFKPLLYAPVSSWVTALPFPLWIARYGRNNGQINLDQLPNIGKWNDWTIWQYSSANGLDLDVANDLSNLGRPMQTYANSVTPTSQQTPVQSQPELTPNLPTPTQTSPNSAISEVSATQIPTVVETLTATPNLTPQTIPADKNDMTTNQKMFIQMISDLSTWIKSWFK